MTYRVECEVVSRDPSIACNSMPLAIDSGRVFEHAQKAVHCARQWVRDFEGTEIPEADRQWYSASDLPRATSRRFRRPAASRASR